MIPYDYSDYDDILKVSLFLNEEQLYWQRLEDLVVFNYLRN
jgi:hypothetical protein